MDGQNRKDIYPGLEVGIYFEKRSAIRQHHVWGG